MEAHIAYLQAKLLWDHLHRLSTDNSDSFKVSDELAMASALSLLEWPKTDSGSKVISRKSLGGLTSGDIMRYGSRKLKFSENTVLALSESLDKTLKDMTIFFHATAAEELDRGTLRSLMLSLCDDVKTEVAGKQADFQKLHSRLKIVLELYQEAFQIHPHLLDLLHKAIETLPAVINANHKASINLLATTIETLLLKLSVARTQCRVSLYGYSSPSIPGITISDAVHHVYEKLAAQQRALETQERDLQSQLQEYELLLELVDGKGGGFAQVVDDLAIVKRETEECLRDLRRLGWTET